MKTKVVRIDVDLYRSGVVVVVADKIDTAISVLEKELGVSLTLPDGTQFTDAFSDNGSGDGWMGMALQKDKATHATLDHEALHAATFILKRCGIHIDEDNDEALSYLHTFILEGIYNKLGIPELIWPSKGRASKSVRFEVEA